MGRPAVFLDRDGVINANVFYPDTGETEAPRGLADYRILPGALDAMLQLQQAGFLLFLISNQPNQAKRKAAQLDHAEIHAYLLSRLHAKEISLKEAFYCFHHPNGVDPVLSGPCKCRKPSPYFLFIAAKRYDVSLRESWMVGDRDTDILCGRAAGVRTIRVDDGTGHCEVHADVCASDLPEAARIIISGSRRPHFQQDG